MIPDHQLLPAKTPSCTSSTTLLVAGRAHLEKHWINVKSVWEKKANACVCFGVCAILHKIFKHHKFLERLLYCYEHTAGTLLLCSNIRASNFEIKCKLERTFFFFFFLFCVDTSYLCPDDLNQRFYNVDATVFGKQITLK